MLGAQEIIVIVLLVIALVYIAYRLIKKNKDHDCDKCGE